MTPEGLRAWTAEDQKKGREAHTARAAQRAQRAKDLRNRGWSIERIAENLGVKPATVSAYFRRARQC